MYKRFIDAIHEIQILLVKKEKIEKDSFVIITIFDELNETITINWGILVFIKVEEEEYDLEILLLTIPLRIIKWKVQKVMLDGESIFKIDNNLTFMRVVDISDSLWNRIEPSKLFPIINYTLQ